jgi:gamma-tubulin complex component 5
MLTAMTKAEDIDEMASYHVRYLARVQEQALLAENLRPIYNAVTSVLDLAVLFHDAHIRLPSSSLLPGQASRSTSSSTTHPHGKMPSKRASKPKLKRRKSVIPAIVEDYDSPSERDDMVDESTPAPSSSSKTSNFQADLQTVDTELKRLLPFVIAGLRNIGRVGAQPVWDALAERLEWGRGGGSGVGPA